MWLNKKWIPFGISILLRIFFFHSEISSIIFLIVGCYYASMFSIQSIKNIRYGIIGIDLLVTLASVGAILIGEYWEFTSVTFLYVFGNAIEKQALLNTNHYVQDLLMTLPQEVMVEGIGYKPLDQIEIDDRVVFKTGDVCGVDGSIVSGWGKLNESSITGESNSVDKTIEDMVYAGSTIDDGQIVVKVEKLNEDTVFGQIIELVEDSKNSKLPIQRLIDTFTKFYTPLTIIIIILAWIFTKNINTALTLLVVSCPGALVIAIPIVNAMALEVLAKQNVLMKQVGTLETLNVINTIAFDKTGTLTNNSLRITEIVSDTYDPMNLVQLVASLEQYSNHPLGEVILNYNQLELLPVESISYDTGFGIKGTVNGKEIRVGQEAYFSYEVPKVDTTVVYVGDSTQFLGYILLEDTLRKEAYQVVEQLNNYNLMILSGDYKDVVTKMANTLGIKTYFARMLPQDKMKLIEPNTMMMVGDGINDAPALTKACVGVSMGGSENRVALEAADVILMDRNLLNIPLLFKIAKKVKLLVIENIVMALGSVLILSLGVFNNTIGMGMGMFIHEITILLVIMNATRLRRS